jgi:hypothetical protein
MKRKLELLCEIIFIDHKLGCLVNRIGRIDEHQLTTYSTNSNDFIIFKERYNFPILKTDIKEIIIHQDNRQLQIKKEDLKVNKYIKSQSFGKIS